MYYMGGRTSMMKNRIIRDTILLTVMQLILDSSAIF